jgi:hypothetical protein
MQTLAKNILALSLASTALISAAPTLHADAASDQISMQLGALQLGYSTPYVPGAADLTNGVAASIYKQGSLSQAATTTTYTTTAFVVKPGTTNITVVANPQSSAYRSQYLAAVTNALATPTLATIPKQTVQTYNPKTRTFVPVANVTATLSPATTTPSLILQAVVAKMPNFASAIVSNAVSATMAGTNTIISGQQIFIPTWGAAPKPTSKDLSSQANVNLFNQKTASAQLVNAGTAASKALAAACAAYAKGTVDWAAFPSTGNPTNPPYLPNFGTTTLGQKGLTNNQINNLYGLANAASAIAANAINGLGVGTGSTNSGVLYGQTQSNVASMTSAMVKALSTTIQSTSINAKTPAGNNFYTYGAISADVFGEVTQLSGTNNYFAGTLVGSSVANFLLQSVITGACSVVKTSVPNLNAVASGVAQGFMATYLFTTTNSPSSMTNTSWLADYETANTGTLNSAIQKASGKTTTDFTGVINQQLNKLFTDYQNYVSGGMTNRAYFNNVAGAAGIHLATTNIALVPLFNGVGSPVTDTTGL